MPAARFKLKRLRGSLNCKYGRDTTLILVLPIARLSLNLA